MNRPQATRDSWKRVAISEQKKQLQVDRTFSEDEYQRLQICKCEDSMRYFFRNYLR